MSEVTQSTQAQTRHLTADDVDVAEGDTLTVAFMDGSPVEVTAEVVTVFNGGSFTARTEDGGYVTVNGREVKQRETQTGAITSESHLSYVEVTEAEDDDDDDEIDPIEVTLHEERPDTNAESDSMWVLAECDKCGKEGYTSEGVCYDAYNSPAAPGLVCEEC